MPDINKFDRIEINGVKLKGFKPGFLLTDGEGNIYSATTELDTECLKNCFQKSEAEELKSELKKIIVSDIKKEVESIKEEAKKVKEANDSFVAKIEKTVDIAVKQKNIWIKNISLNNDVVKKLSEKVQSFDNKLSEILKEVQYSITFDGVDEYVDLKSEINLDKDFSVAISFIPYDKTGTLISTDSFTIYLEDNKIKVQCLDNDLDITSNEEIDLYRINRLVVTRKKDLVKIHLNGISDNDDFKKLAGRSGNLYFSKGISHFMGELISISTWDRSLESFEIKDFEKDILAHRSLTNNWNAVKKHGFMNSINQKLAELHNIDLRFIRPLVRK